MEWIAGLGLVLGSSQEGLRKQELVSDGALSGGRVSLMTGYLGIIFSRRQEKVTHLVEDEGHLVSFSPSGFTHSLE